MSKKICKLIKQTKNHYLIALKGNQKNLLNEVKFNFICDEAVIDTYETTEKNRGRIEYRKVSVTQYLDGINTKGWKGLITIIMINRERIINEKRSKETQYFISDLTESAKIFYEGIRGHWSIENSMHG